MRKSSPCVTSKPKMLWKAKQKYYAEPGFEPAIVMVANWIATAPATSSFSFRAPGEVDSISSKLPNVVTSETWLTYRIEHRAVNEAWKHPRHRQMSVACPHNQLWKSCLPPLALTTSPSLQPFEVLAKIIMKRCLLVCHCRSIDCFQLASNRVLPIECCQMIECCE